jgi:AraC-like DNA-binding protein
MTNYHELNEVRARGTPDFPIELYRIDSAHSRYIMPFHWHSEYELIRIDEGEFNVIVGEEDHRAGPGDVLLVGSGTIHGGIPKNCVYHCVVFDTALLMGRSNSGWSQELLRLTRQNDGAIPSFFPAGSGRIPALVEEVIVSLRKSDRDGRQLSTLGALYSLFGCLARQYPAARGELRTGGDAKMKAVFRWIEENYAEPITLETLAAAAGMNPHYFCEVFKRCTRRSPIDYLNLYRIDSACRMLKVSGCSVTDAAFSCGFNDLSYFVKTFKRYKGVTPRQYRRRFEWGELLAE